MLAVTSPHATRRSYIKVSGDASVEVTELRSEKDLADARHKEAEERALAEAAKRQKLQDQYDRLEAAQKSDAAAREAAEQRAAQFEKEVSEAYPSTWQ